MDNGIALGRLKRKNEQYRAIIQKLLAKQDLSSEEKEFVQKEFNNSQE